MKKPTVIKGVIVLRTRKEVHNLQAVLLRCSKMAHALLLSLKKKWNNWKQHETAEKLGISLVLPLLVFIALRATVFAAPDLQDDWDLSTASDYTYSSGVEVTGGVAKLKAQNYSSDANTRALYHFDEISGTNASDSSTNGNDATLSGGSFGVGNLNNAVSLNGTSDYISAPSSPSLQLGQQQTIEAWTKLDSAFDSSSQDRRQSIVDKGDYQLYYDNETGKLTYELADASATTWSQAGGNDINSGWDLNGKSSVSSMTKIGTKIYASLGLSTGDAEVWEYDGNTWTKVGGGPESINNSWAAQTFETVSALATDGTNLFAALGNNLAGDGEVWKYDGNTWMKIGGDSINGGWTNYAENVFELDYFSGDLYAGIGSSANDAEVWKWDGSAWTKIGGDSINGGWTTNYEMVYSLTNDGTNLYAGLGSTAGDSEVWRWNGSAWTKIGGDSINGGWDTTIESVRVLRYLGGNLYAGLGDTAGDGDLWRWNGTSWTQIGGDGLNGGWAGSTYEYVGSLTYDGSNIYAGLGASDGDGEVWKWDGSTWVKIGGDGLNGGWIAGWGDAVLSLRWDGSQLLAGTYDAGGSSWVYAWNGTSWSLIGGNGVNKSWGFYNLAAVQVMQTVGNYLYAGMGNAAGSSVVWQWDGTRWSLIGGQGVNGSWAPNTYEAVLSMANYKGNLYVGLGSTANATDNDGEVWMWDGSTWSKVGGDGANGSWPFSASHYGEVDSLAADTDYLYAGLGAGSTDGEVWRYNGSTWTKIGGDSLNGGWTNYVENIYSMGFFRGNLVVGVGRSVGDDEVWQWSSGIWTKIGGDGLNGGWNGSYSVESLISYSNQLCAGLGNITGSATLWCWNGASWNKVGGDNVAGSWDSGTYEKTKTLVAYNGDLYAGLGNTAGDSDVWKWNGTLWTKVAGNGINGGWGGAVEEVESFSPYKGKLYAGTGLTGNADANVWVWGNNGYVQSSQSSFDTNWHHVAATYDGAVIKLYVDGALQGSQARALTVASSDRSLLIGTGYGGREYGKPQARFAGQLDELRLSDSARTSFTTHPYSTTPQTVSLTDAVRKSGVEQWNTFSHTQSPTGGTINYRLSSNDGATWLYWDGGAWVESTTPAMANTPAVVSAHFEDFPVTFDGMKWQAVLSGDGFHQTSLDGVSAEATSDANPPSTNASSITAQRVKDGANLNEDDWTNGSSPFFSWAAGSDSGSGILGYCAYLGTDQTANPISTKGLLGTNQTATGGHCAFITPDASLDLASPGVLASPLSSSNDKYYLTLRAIDKAGNVYPTSTQFSFKFDNTPPTNPGFISAPSGFINTKDVEMTWQNSGGSAPQDTHSGVIGLQYRIGSGGQWYGDSHNGSGDVSDLLANDGTYRTTVTPDYANLNEGINTIYFRTWDAAGNFTTNYTTATLKINTSGAPSEPNNLVASPASNTVNSFSFDWNEPTTYVGDERNITYCYTVNVTPGIGSCNFTAPGSTELTLGAYATQPGTNTLYVVAKDESGNVNYANSASVIFTANTTAPGLPLNTDIVDVSIKNTSNWRLALTWDPPLTGTVQAYRITRSTDGTHFSAIGTSTSTTYIDAGLSQQLYYYRVSACDSTNNCGASGNTVSETPTGKFTTPATLVSGPSVSDVTTKHATIRWSTDRASDSKVALGTQSGQYSPSEIGNSTQVSSHEIKLDNLSPGTTYYFKAKWTDEDGNTGTSQELTFTTAPAPTIKEAVAANVSLSNATIDFTIRGASRAKIYYGAGESFGGLKEVNTSETESHYAIPLDGLTDGTKYYYMISAIDKEGTEYRGNVATFETPQRPRISNLTFQPVEGEPTSTQRVTWTTNVPSTSTVIYTIINGQPIEIGDSKMVTEHSMVISGLRDDSQYSLVAQSRDASGNLATSDRQSFHTALDTRPPKISDIVVEASIRGSGSEARGQIVISWRTDEPSTSQVAYTEGSGSSVFNSKTAEDSTLTTEHIVIISDLPTSRVFSIQPVSTDNAENAGTGETQTAIVGRASDNALTIVFNALKKIFGL